MDVKADIISNFECFNIFATEEVISKCVQLCSKYNMTAEDLVDQWFAYTSSMLRGAAPTVKYLSDMERKELMKSNDDRKKPSNHIVEDPPTPLITRRISPDRGLSKATFTDNVSGTPKKSQTQLTQPRTPLQATKILPEPLVEISSTPSTPSQTYSKRTDARTVRCTFGSSKTNFKRTADVEIKVRPFSDNCLKYDKLIMYDVLRVRRFHVNDMIEDLFHSIKCKYPSITSEDDGESYSDNVLLYGRVVSETEGKINSHSILLERTAKFNGKTVALNVNNLKQYSLFPGQVVVVKSTCLFGSRGANRKDTFLVKELYIDGQLDFPLERPLIADNLQIVIACGPFTVQDNLLFEPLNDLLAYVKEHKPHVLFLTGPFYDITHKGILGGELKAVYAAFFSDLIEEIMKQTPSETHVVLVSSLRDPHHFAVYPTPPYKSEPYPNLTLLPDPCTVNINGLVIGATTADVVFDIGSYEIHLDKISTGAPDRIGRLVSHLFKQKSFYPLDPPSKQIGIDSELMEEYGRLTCKPHVMILPSNLRYFIKNVDGCLVINPERLTKGNGGGCFARLSVSVDSTGASICNSSSCEVLRI